MYNFNRSLLYHFGTCGRARMIVHQHDTQRIGNIVHGKKHLVHGKKHATIAIADASVSPPYTSRWKRPSYTYICTHNPRSQFRPSLCTHGLLCGLLHHLDASNRIDSINCRSMCLYRIHHDFSQVYSNFVQFTLESTQHNPARGSSWIHFNYTKNVAYPPPSTHSGFKDPFTSFAEGTATTLIILTVECTTCLISNDNIV